MAIVAVIGVIGSLGGNGDEATTPTAGEVTNVEPTAAPVVIEYTEYTVSQLVSDLEENAMAAEKKYVDTYVKVTGRLDGIDSAGKYITIYPTDNEFAFTGVQCYIKTDEQSNRVLELKTGNTLTIKGKITSAGEVLGYSLDIDTIE